MQPAHAVDLLRHVAGQKTHGETFSRVVGVYLTEIDELLPCYLELFRHAVHILTYHILGERVVTGRHRSVGGKERRAANHLQRLAEREPFGLDEIERTTYAYERGMTLVAVVDIGTYAHFAQGLDTAHA